MAVAVLPDDEPWARDARRDAPRTVSARRHLRDGLPEIYRVPDSFGMRFLGALEEVLDPIVATLDSLPAHLDPDVAPDHALTSIAAWLGVDEVEGLPEERRREAVRRVGELGRRRGTRAGLQLALELFFPDVPVVIKDGGGVTIQTDADADVVAVAPASFEVFAHKPLDPAEALKLDRTIARWKPVHATYVLRVSTGTEGELPVATQPPEAPA